MSHCLISSAGAQTLPATEREREQLRELFRPARVDLLFIGESPPASGRFFYSRNSGLYRAMLEAFRTVDPKIDHENFLTTFQACGCYLVDLSSEPVDKLSPAQRRTQRSRGEKALAHSIAELQPAQIAPVLRSILRNVENAIRRAGWTGPVLQLPYPGRWSRHRAAFIHDLAPTLHRLSRS